MQGTPNWDIQYAEASDNMSFEAISAAQASSVEDALDDIGGRNALNSYDWADLAARTAQTGMEEGDRGFQRDNDHQYFYTGAAWRDNTVGLVPMIPSSVAGTGVSLAPNGLVSFTTATAVSVNGCFNSDFDYYAATLHITATSTGNAKTFRMRLAGTDNSTSSSYSSQYQNNSSTSVTTANAANTSGVLNSGLGSGEDFLILDFGAPALALPTFVFSRGASYVSTATAMPMTATRHNQSTAYDGFSIIPGAGNITGTIRVYGYAK